MKYLITLFLLLPFSAYNQVGVSHSGRELGLNLGHAFDNAFQDDFSNGGFIRSAINYYQSNGHLQYGLTIEGGTNSNDYWYLSPGAILNYKFSLTRTYFYVGIMAGYICSDDILKSQLLIQNITQGYVFGVHGGFVQPLSNRISLTSELAVRSTQVWTSYKEYPTESNIVIYFPITFGFRYSF